MKRRSLIGDRAFYQRLFAVMMPILIQNVITNFVSLLDNLMVGQVGTEPMSGVAIVNQLLFVFNLCIFGGLAGPGIFTAQFYGKSDPEGIRDTFRAKLWVAFGAVLLFAAALLLWGDGLIGLFLHEGGEGLSLEATLGYGRSYLRVMLLQMPLFALVQVYAGTLRETGETLLPMRAGIAAVLVNLVFNYLLIFGKLGLPALGVTGAAIATVLSRVVECGVVVIWTHRHRDRAAYITGAWRSLRVPAALAKKIAVTGLPLLVNEVLWSAGMTTLNQCYSVRGLEAVSATNISSTVFNLFLCFCFSMGNTVAIMIGQLLGAGETERAVDEDRKLNAFSVVLGTAVGGLMALVAPLIPEWYNTTAAVKTLASQLLLVNAALLPFIAYTNVCYFTLRSGGNTLIVFLFDSAYIWLCCVSLAFVLSRFTALPLLPMYIAVQALELVKCAVGFFLVRSKKWVNNLVA
ncbi:MAG: MATE family efflux transporter [Oscillospiraceae bacterium]|nr:MATE family efflux transporter [Oscillospiraceae bacterium]